MHQPNKVERTSQIKSNHKAHGYNGGCGDRKEISIGQFIFHYISFVVCLLFLHTHFVLFSGYTVSESSLNSYKDNDVAPSGDKFSYGFYQIRDSRKKN